LHSYNPINVNLWRLAILVKAIKDLQDANINLWKERRCYSLGASARYDITVPFVLTPIASNAWLVQLLDPG